MNSNYTIKFNQVSKKYSKSLDYLVKYSLEDLAKNTLGFGVSSTKLRPGEFWAVNNVSFKLRRGEALGIIGPNGSGKSTILKLISGILQPDTGEIKVRGRVGALIQLGAGFHPLLTGRENIYVNGSILGMTHKEIEQKFNDIANFADIGSFLDSPVKSYSDGMVVRLGFSVAVHCQPDILLVDEVLAVGDLEFQTKCFDFITNKLLASGCSIILVSHNRYAIQDICDRAIFLKKGQLQSEGGVNRVMTNYLASISKSQHNVLNSSGHYKTGRLQNGITQIQLSKNEVFTSKFKTGDPLKIRFYYNFPKAVEQPSVALSLFHDDHRYHIASSTDYLFNLHSGYDGLGVKELGGKGFWEVNIPHLYLPVGHYTFSIYLYLKHRMNLAQKVENAGHLELVPSQVGTRSLIDLPRSWKVNRLQP